MKVKITTSRLKGKYDKDQVIEADDNSPLGRLMQTLVNQGEATDLNKKEEVKKEVKEEVKEEAKKEFKK